MGMKAFLTGLSGPKTWNDLADFLSKTIFAAAAAAIALVAGCYSEARQRAEKAAEDRRQLEADNQAKHLAQGKRLLERLSNTRDEIALFLDYMPKERSDPLWRVKVSVFTSYCAGETNIRLAERVGRELCTHVSTLGKAMEAETKVEALALASVAARSGNPGAYTRSAVAASQNLAMAASESAAGPSSDRWFAVVASVPVSQPEAVRGLAADLNRRLEQAGLPPRDVRVYRTVISNSFAITSGGPRSEADAKARARMLRNAGAVPDAFAQPDRRWVAVPELRPN